METLKRLFFEQPLPIYIVLAGATAVAAVVWHFRRTRRCALVVLAGPVLAAVVGLTAYFVETDLEQINSALDAIGLAIEADDVDAAAAYLDPACYAPARDGRSISRDALIEIARVALLRRPVKRILTSGLEIQIDGASATTQIKTRILLDSGECFDARWRLEWTERKAGPQGAGWRIICVEALYPPGLTNWDF